METGAGGNHRRRATGDRPFITPDMAGVSLESRPDAVSVARWTADGPLLVLQFEQMSNTITVRLPEDLAKWLDDAARKAGLPKGRIVREQLEKARNSAGRPFLRLAGAISGPGDLSMRKGFSRK
ncbi:MAG TPA: hypothetical protein VE959_37590 [Bryobacteraceae bacterium]|nr:hypothetical protein [Bryobacteraceae bacterium]